jgi:hypothetical protein
MGLCKKKQIKVRPRLESNQAPSPCKDESTKLVIFGVINSQHSSDYFLDDESYKKY